MTRAQLLRKVQETDFVLYDVGLFLDTHPTNQMAIDFFKKYQREHERAVADYEASYGPLTAFSADADKGWGWVQGPWPWEMEG